MAIVAVLGASFSLREEEPSPCNVRIAKEVIRVSTELIKQGHVPVVVVQWEVGLAMQKLGKLTDDTWEKHQKNGGWAQFEVGQYDEGRYPGTKEVLEEALPIFMKLRATRFVGVAQPFLHQPYLYWLARKHFKLMWRKVRGVGFDKESTQWWCRSWWQLFSYTAWTTLGGAHGHSGRQAKA